MLSRRDFLKAAGLGAACWAGHAWSAESPAVRRPNFVFILVDDLGWRDLGCFGSTFYETPHLDRLANEGVRFTSAYAACPVCSPTRASIMTGKYPARLGTTDYFGAPQPDKVAHHWTQNKPLLPAPYLDRLPLEEITIAEALKEAGYSTFFAGKWHLGGDGFLPEEQGFDINKGGHRFGGPPGGYFSPYKNPKLESGPPGEHLPARLAEETVRFMREHKDGPFLAYLSFYSVHVPLQAREDLKAKYEKKAAALDSQEPVWGREGDRDVRMVQSHPVYAGMVEAMDQAVGNVLNALDELGIADNTIVFFMSDNGGLSTAEGHATSNLPLRGGKGWLYEGGIREPMIVKWPGVAQPGTVCGEPVISTDFYPTMLDMAGLPAKPRQHVDGMSFAGLLKGGKRPKRDALYWHYPHYGNQGGTPGAAIRAGDWKLIEFFEERPPELYNLREDLSEKRNMASEKPEKVRTLRAMLHRWQKDVGARFPTPNPDAKS
ncbi:MAG TPA: sulfatase [Candidatus Hydrogenedentes bacterium]|nr:sulfatase [Candidatus Hydrogenedentota bacterium]HOV75308.1 sulfatase [Candidatus Hydrogenedentota bacterium]